MKVIVRGTAESTARKEEPEIAFRVFLERRRLPYTVTVQGNQTVLPSLGRR